MSSLPCSHACKFRPFLDSYARVSPVCTLNRPYSPVQFSHQGFCLPFLPLRVYNHLTLCCSIIENFKKVKSNFLKSLQVAQGGTTFLFPNSPISPNGFVVCELAVPLLLSFSFRWSDVLMPQAWRKVCSTKLI